VGAGQRQRVIEAVARELAERATGIPAYLVDEETFDGWLQDAEARVARTPRPELSSLSEAVERAQGPFRVESRIFCDWVAAALVDEVAA
jgi:hypothetical protein